MKKIFTLFAALAMVMSMSATPYLRGSFNNWGTENEFINGECSINLAASTTYEFKIANADWSGEYAGGKTITKNNCNEVSIPAGGNNAKITSDLAGSYIFKWDATSKKLTVTYPTVVLEKKDITVKAKMPASWGTTITAWVWTAEDANGKAVTPEKQGDWYVVTQNTTISYVIFRNGDGWNGNKNQTVDLAFQESTCVELTQSGDSKATYTIVDCPDFYNVNVTANAEGENVVTGGGEHEEGKEVTVTASEDLEGWVFIGWTEDGEFVANDPEYTFVVNGDVELVAIYAQLMELEVNDLEIITEPVIGLTGTAELPGMTLSFQLIVDDSEQGEDGEFYLTEDSKVYLNDETELEFQEGIALIDMMSNTAQAQVLAAMGEALYLFKLNMSAAAAEPTNVLVTNAVKSYDEGSGALKLTGLWEGAEVFVEIGGYEGKESIEYSTPQGVLFETPDVAAFGNEASIIVAGEDITVVCNGLKPMMGNDVYNVTITTLSEVSTALDNLNTTVAPVKMIENGQLIIVKDGVQYNAQGAILK